MASALERRYRRLLFAYPRGYREARGDEILSTLLDLAVDGRKYPSLADVADLLAGGLRRRLGAPASFEAGLVLAAPFALALAAGISAYAWWRVEPVQSGVHIGSSALFGAFRTLGPVAYAAWLLAALARSVLPLRAGRAIIAGAIGVTVLVPVVAPLTTVDRPPLWVLMSLVVFGGLALAGTASAPSTDERLAVPAGAVAVAVTATAVVLVWPPVGGGFGYYYQPTIARVGTVVAATVATVAVLAAAALARRRPTHGWLWATALLGLPAGWLGPFDSAGLRLAAEAQAPHFGRLAQVLLATCLAAGAMIWLVRRGSPAVDARRQGLATAGAAALGTLAGLAAFVLLAGAGVLGFAGVPLRSGLPGHVIVTGSALLAAGGLALLAVPTLRLGVLGVSTLAGLAAAWGIAAYDNGWTLSGWGSFPQTASLVSTIALLPLSACAVAAAAALLDRAATWRRRTAAAGVLAVSLGWLGYATLPHVLHWGPVLLVLLSCVAVLALTGRRSSPAT